MANFLSTSLKNLFISLGASKTSDNNYAVPLLNATTKEPAGDMTISQLASVLGGPPSMFVDVTDANKATKPGLYQASVWANNTPASSGILIMPYYYTGYWKFQLFCDNASTHLWFRSGTSSGYSPWKLVV